MANTPDSLQIPTDVPGYRTVWVIQYRVPMGRPMKVPYEGKYEEATIRFNTQQDFVDFYQEACAKRYWFKDYFTMWTEQVPV